MSQNKTPKNNLPFVFKEYTFSELKEGESKFISDFIDIIKRSRSFSQPENLKAFIKLSFNL